MTTTLSISDQDGTIDPYVWEWQVRCFGTTELPIHSTAPSRQQNDSVGSESSEGSTVVLVDPRERKPYAETMAFVRVVEELKAGGQPTVKLYRKAGCDHPFEPIDTPKNVTDLVGGPTTTQ